MDIAFQSDQYILRKQVFALSGILRIYNPQDQLVLYCQQKLFKLKDDIRIYADESKSRELLSIHARQIIDFSAFFDVMDSQYSTVIGGLRRKGFRSMVLDEWEIFDHQEKSIGILKEDSFRQALLRRLLFGTLLPQNYNLSIGTDLVAGYNQRFRLFRYELEIDFQMDTGKKLDHRLGLAAAILLAIIEGRQHNQA